MITVYEDMLRKIVVDYIDFENNKELQNERLEANIDEACEVLKIKRLS